MLGNDIAQENIMMMKCHSRVQSVVRSLAVKVFFAFGLALGVSPANADNWYIDNAATGNNTGTSWVNAWRNFSSIAGVKPGDVVYISGGSTSKTYTGVNQWRPLGGVQGNPVTYRIGQDPGHNGVAIFNGQMVNQSFWLFANANLRMAWVTVDGNYGGENHIVVTNYWNTLYCDDSAQGLVLRYITASAQLRAYRCNQMEYDHLILGPTMNVDRQIVGLGSGQNYTNNLIRNCTIYAYYQHNVNSTGGNGDDHMANINAVTVKNNNFIGVYVPNYTGSQHQDAIQSTGWIWCEGNYFENIANYGYFGEFWGNGGNIRVLNNVLNYPDPALRQQPTQAISVGSSATGVVISDVIIANNTVYGAKSAIQLGNGYPSTSLVNCYIVNNLVGNSDGIHCLTGQGTGLQMMGNKVFGGGGVTPANTVPPLNNNPVTFVNVANKDFHLASGDTGARDAGLPWPAFLTTKDKDGNNRPQGSAWDLGAYEFTTGASATNLPPVVTPIGHNASDVNPNVAGIQVYEGTVVQYSATASDPNGNPLTWQWTYTVNGGSQVVFQSGSGTVPSISFSYNAGTANRTYVWTLIVNDGSVSSQSSITMGVQAPPSAQGLTIMATNGLINGLFTIGNNFISQPTMTTTVAAGGSASYNFTITNAGYYVIQTLVNAPDASANSLFVNIDGVPVDPVMVWDILTTSGFENRLVSWRGSNGTPDANEFVPKVFNLGAGVHQLNVVGREANTQLRSFSILQLPSPPQNLRVLPNVVSSPSFSVGN